MINPGGVTLGISGWGCAVVTLVAYVASVSSRGSSRKLGQEPGVARYLARYLAFADLSNIFLIQSLLYFQRSPVMRHRRVTFVM